MPMEREAYEELLNELNNPDLDHTRRTEILTDLRNDYNTVHTEFTELTQANEKLTASNNDLLEANSKLFRQAGFYTKEDKNKVEKKAISETITLEDLEKNAV